MGGRRQPGTLGTGCRGSGKRVDRGSRLHPPLFQTGECFPVSNLHTVCFRPSWALQAAPVSLILSRSCLPPSLAASHLSPRSLATSISLTVTLLSVSHLSPSLGHRALDKSLNACLSLLTCKMGGNNTSHHRVVGTVKTEST